MGCVPIYSKNFTDGQVKLLFEKYSKGEIKLNYIT